MKENFWIVNFRVDNCEATALRIDFTKKKLSVVKSLQLQNHQIFHHLKRIFSFYFYPHPYKVIFIFDSRLAVTHYGVISSFRDDYRKPIEEGELNTLVSQSVWKFFDQNRKGAAVQLGLNETEILLSNVSVYDFKIDNKRVINLLRHSAKKVDFYFSQTFTKRSFLKDLIYLLPRRAELVGILESGSAIAHLFSKTAKKDRFFFVAVKDSQTDLFFNQNQEIGFWNRFEWGEDNLYKKIGENLKLSDKISQLVVDVFLDNKTSDYFRRQFKNIIESELVNLIGRLNSTAKKMNASEVYLDFPILNTILKSGLKLRSISTKMITPVNSEILKNSFGFDIDGDIGVADLAALIENYFFAPAFPLTMLNHLAKRRMRWLIPATAD